jgi:hypothetical protein
LEKKRQEENDKLRQHFAEYANAFHTWLRGIEYVEHFFSSPINIRLSLGHQ